MLSIDLYLFLSVVARSGKTPLCAVLNLRGYYQIHFLVGSSHQMSFSFLLHSIFVHMCFFPFPIVCQ